MEKTITINCPSCHKTFEANLVNDSEGNDSEGKTKQVTCCSFCAEVIIAGLDSGWTVMNASELFQTPLQLFELLYRMREEIVERNKKDKEQTSISA